MVRRSLLVNMLITKELQQLHTIFGDFISYIKQRDELLYGPLEKKNPQDEGTILENHIDEVPMIMISPTDDLTDEQNYTKHIHRT